MRQTFRQEEAEQILRDAIRREAEQQVTPAAGAPALDVSKDRLAAMAEELGISPAALDAVLRDREEAAVAAQRAASEAELRREFITHRRAGFLPDLYSYLGVNLMLFCIWLLTGAGYPWFVWPLLGWGIGIYFHAVGALPTRGPVFERDFVAWQERRRKRLAKEAKRNARRLAEAELDE